MVQTVVASSEVEITYQLFPNKVLFSSNQQIGRPTSRGKLTRSSHISLSIYGLLPAWEVLIKDLLLLEEVYSITPLSHGFEIEKDTTFDWDYVLSRIIRVIQQNFADTPITQEIAYLNTSGSGSQVDLHITGFESDPKIKRILKILAET